MGEPTAPTGGETIPGPIPRDPPPPPGYVDPLEESPVLGGVAEQDRAGEARQPERAEPAGGTEEQPHSPS
jgi:hypothetical protein